MLKIIKTILLYSLFILFLIFAFVHTLFPQKKAAIYFSDFFSKKSGIAINIDKIELKIPFKIKIINPRIDSKLIDNLNLKFVELNPNFLPLLSGKVSFKIAAAGFNGGINSTIKTKIKDYKNNFYIDLKFSKINLKLLERSLKINNLELGGVASGRIKLNYNDKKGTFSSFSDLSEFVFKSDNLILPIDILKINRVELKGEIENKKIVFKESSVRSKAGLTTFFGSIDTKKRIMKSSLSIEGKVIPDLSYLGKNKNHPTLSMIFSIIKGKRDIKYSIGGNLINPRPRLK